MASPQTYNFPDHITGDTFPGIQFEILINNVALNLTGASIYMHLKEKLNSTNKTVFSTVNNALEINDATAGKFKFKKQIVNVFPTKYLYDIEIHLADGSIYTYISGNWTINKGITAL